MKLTRKTYDTRGEKVRDFLIGFFGWFVVNAALWFAFSLAMAGIAALTVGATGANSTANDAISMISALVGCIPLILNGAALLFFAFTRHWIAFGILAAFGASLLIALCLTLVIVGVCFSAISGLALPGQ